MDFAMMIEDRDNFEKLGIDASSLTREYSSND